MLVLNSTTKSSGFAWVLRLLTVTPTLKLLHCMKLPKKGWGGVDMYQRKFDRVLTGFLNWKPTILAKLQAFLLGGKGRMDLRDSLQWKCRTEGGDDHNASMYPWCIHGHSKLMQFVVCFFSRIEPTTSANKGLNLKKLHYRSRHLFLILYHFVMSWRGTVLVACTAGCKSQISDILWSSYPHQFWWDVVYHVAHV